MIKIYAAVAVTALTCSAALAADLSMDLTTGTLSPTCTFSNAVVGSLAYSEGAGKFQATGGTASTIDIFYRNMSSISVINAGNMGGTSAAYDGVDYIAGTSAFGATPVLNTGVASALAGEVTLNNTVEATETLSLLPDLDVKPAVTVAQNTTYSTTFLVTCVQ